MFLKNLTLTNFRNHKKFETEFDRNTTLILGDNGTGKTNVLESIFMLSTTKPFRGDYDVEVINFEAEFARIEGMLDEDLLEMFITKKGGFENTSQKKVKVNKSPKTLISFAGRLKSVLFCPEDIQIITGSPSLRRNYLDHMLTQISPIYKKAHSNYAKALRQRNKLLEIIRETRTGYDQMAYWNQLLALNGSIIQKDRNHAIEFLNTSLMSYEATLNKTNTDFELIYARNDISIARLETTFERDIAAGTTLSGPHRDDFEIKIDSKNISSFGSRGQQRTAMLALKLAEVDYIQNCTEEHPILLLDDIFSELDDKHKKAVLETISSKQTIITGADKSLLEKEIPYAKLIEI